MNPKKMILAILIISLLLSLVPAFRFLIRLGPAFYLDDLSPDKTMIGTSFGNPIGEVFNTIYTGGNNFKHDKNIYDIENVGIDISGGAFVYPPLMAAFGAAFGIFRLADAYFIFLSILLLSVFLFLYYGIKHIYGLKNLYDCKKKTLAALVILLVSLSTPLVRQLQWGHYIILLLAFYSIVYFYGNDPKNPYRWQVTGIATGLATSLMFYSAILFPYLLLRKQFKEFFLGIAVFALSFFPFIYNPSSGAGFLLFVKNADKLAFIPRVETGGTFFSIQQFLYKIDPLLQKLYLLLNLILFLYLTFVIWHNIRHTSKNKPIAQDIYRAYYAIILLFILMIDIWLSEHHLPITLLALLLLIGEQHWQIMLTAGYLMTNTFLYDFHIQLNGAFLYTYIRQLGVIILFFYALYVLFAKMRRLRFSLIPVLKLKNR